MGRSHQPSLSSSSSSSTMFRGCWRRGPGRLVLVLSTLLALLPHRCTSQSRPSGGPTYEPTVLPENATDRPTVSPAPTITANPTREPSPSNATTTAPETPTDAPISVTSQVPSDVPTEGTVATGDPTGQPTTREPSPGPTTEVPSPGPTPTPGEPTPKPIKVTPQPTVAGTKRSASLPSVVSFYDNVGALNQSEIAEVLAKTETWFMASFNNKTYTKRRFLQSSGLNPSQSGVRNVLTQLKFRSTKVESQGLQLTYDQELQWIETVTSYTPQVLAGLPYNYNPTNQKLASILKSSVNGFENVGSPLTTPDFPAAPTTAPTPAPVPAPSGGSSSPLSTGAIVGIAVAGAVGLPLLCYGLYLLCGPGSDKDSTRPGGSTGYVSAGSAPPSKVTTSRDDVSAMDYPRVEDRESMADYQDQSVATVDYDYSKAYGGAGDNSVVSSAGGTMGENTRQTAGDPAAATLAARAALGASFDSELGGGTGAGAAAAAAAAGAGGFRDDGDGNLKEEIIEINAPAGKLGVVIDTPDDGAPVVHAVKDSSVIANLICVGDKLIAVDDEDVRSMTAIKVSKLISKKSMNPSRKLTIVRTTYMDDTDG